MTIDSIYSKERGHRLSPLYTDRHYSFKCYQFAVQFKRQPHYFLPRSLLLFLFLPPLVAEAGIFIGRDLSPTDFATRSVNVRIVVAKWEKKGVHVRYVKLECFSVSWIILNWSGEWNSNSSASSFHFTRSSISLTR